MAKRANFTRVCDSMEHRPHLTFMRPITLNMIFSVTYYMDLCHVICIYCISHILPTNVKLVV